MPAATELGDPGRDFLSAVALLRDLPQHGLVRGQVGTIVETLAPDVFEVEFSDNDGRTYATVALRADQLMVLHHERVHGDSHAAP